MHPSSRVGRSVSRGAGALHDYGRKHRPDYVLLLLTLILLAIGVIVVFSISSALAIAKGGSGSYYVNRQLIAIGLSLVAFIVASQLKLTAWQALAKPIVAAAALVTVVALLMPVNPDYPAHRWIRLGSLSFQSAELVKFALLLGLAGFLADRARNGEIADFHRTLKPILIGIGIVGVIVVFIQSDLGSAGVMLAMVASMAFVAGLPMKRIIMVGGIIAIGTLLAVASTPYRRERLSNFLNPGADCQQSGYQQCQALIAVGSGGLAGQGLGSDVQAFGYLPLPENDSIFAVYAEKFGFIGSTILIGLFVGLFMRMKRVAERAPDMFTRLLVVGVLTWLAAQAMINIGAMIGVLPLKGITLPLISYGGTSVLFIMAAMGLVYQVSQYALQRVNLRNEGDENHDNRYDGRRVRRPYNASPRSRS